MQPASAEEAGTNGSENACLRPKQRVGSSKTKRRKATARARISSRPTLLPGVDGRTLLARRFYDVSQAVIADQGGMDRCSEARIQLCRRFAGAAVQAEALEARLAKGEQVDVATYSQLVSTMTRVVQRLGINRRLRNVTPTLHEYLEGRAAEPEEAEG